MFLLLFIVCEATCFDLLIRSSSGLLTIELNDIYVLGSQHFYVIKMLSNHVNLLQVKVTSVLIIVNSHSPF